MRDNPGGDLGVVSAIADDFLSEGVITYTEDKNGKKEYIYAQSGGMDFPTAIITNGQSASASEVLTAALHDNGKAITVGEKTFGKGILQSIYDLSQFGYKGAIKLTTGYYCPPCGENYHGVGITPEIQKQQGEAAGGKNFYLLTEAEDDQLRAAVSAAVRNFS